MFDLVVKSGYVIDGTGNPWFKADIGIKQDKIVKIGYIESVNAKKIIDASGLMVSPGFIDIHSHSDFVLLVNPRAESKVRQGVTTEVIGNCGFSAAPLMGAAIDMAKEISQQYELEIDWSSFKEFFNRLKKQGVAINIATLVGHGTVRAAAMGFSDRPPTPKEMEMMKVLVDQAMQDGVFGLSSGLFYTPGSYAQTEEIVELSRVVAKYGGIYSSHIRNEGDYLIDAEKEAIEIGSRASVSVQISHHKACGQSNWGKVKETLMMIDKARSEGIDVMCDIYPYIASSTGLDALLPPWAHEGSHEKLLEKLKDPKTRELLKKDMQEGLSNWESMAKQSSWDKFVIARCKKHEDFEGKNLLEISKSRNIDPSDLVFDLLAEEEDHISIIAFEINEDDMHLVLSHPTSMIGSDGYALATYGMLSESKPHPRSYGTFPRVIGKYVREKKLLTIQDAIRKMTSLPAQRLGLKNRGILREGCYADIVIFDKKKIIDKATFDNPHQYPDGIEYVLVNGQITLEKGKHRGTLAGKVLCHTTN
ncbi:MAG: D-aminoacylase [candidate division WS2 bacterium]|nr:D-aminoacylase [Candidatus Lithacetigena glycinireducens]